MYIQLTTRCNMTCEHCCFACTTDGEDITESNLKKALAITEGLGEHLNIGGGEPTLHPKFMDFLKDTVFSDLDDEMLPFIVTNGSVTKTALKLASLTKKGLIECYLSQDNYHNDIDCEVVEAFESINKVRNVTGNEMQQGRAEEWGVREGCACDTFFIAPNGDFKACGCLSAPALFNITNMTVEECLKELYYLSGEYENLGSVCHKDLEKIELVEVVA